MGSSFQNFDSRLGGSESAATWISLTSPGVKAMVSVNLEPSLLRVSWDTRSGEKAKL